MKRNGKRTFWQNMVQVPTLVSLITVLVSVILVIFQFTGIIHLRVDELLCLSLALLIIICGTLFGERFGMLREIQQKQESLERLINQKNK